MRTFLRIHLNRAVLFLVLFYFCPQTSFAAFQELTYQTDGGIQLSYVIAAPSFQDGAKYPLWIFQPGDGTILDTFQPSQYQSMMEQFTQAFGIALIMPELRRNLYVNDLKKYCELDFFHRIVDLSRLIDAAKQLNFVNPSKVILFGHSAGGEIATLTAQTRSDVWGVATYGTGVVSEGESSSNIPLPPGALDNDCSDSTRYKMRSGIFWRQLFIEAKVFSNIQKLSIPYLAMFGGNDNVTPFDNTETVYATRLLNLKPNFSYEVFPGLDHGGFAEGPAVFEKVKVWSQ